MLHYTSTLHNKVASYPRTPCQRATAVAFFHQHGNKGVVFYLPLLPNAKHTCKTAGNKTAILYQVATMLCNVHFLRITLFNGSMQFNIIMIRNFDCRYKLDDIKKHRFRARSWSFLHYLLNCQKRRKVKDIAHPNTPL